MISRKSGYELNFPAYFINKKEVYIKLDLDIETNEIYCQTISGTPYAFDKLIGEARMITENEYKKKLGKVNSTK